MIGARTFAAAAVLALPLRAAAGQVGPDVLAALRERPRVRVVIALREPRGGAHDLARRGAEVGTIQAGVLGGLAPHEFRITHRWEAISALAGEVTPSGLGKLLDDPDVLRVDLDAPAQAHNAESAALIRANQVHGLGLTGKGVVVAVLDTGMDTDHPDLRGGLIFEHCECTITSGAGCCPNGSATQTGPGSAEDDHGHGTNVAGVITSDGGAAPRGIAPDAEIVAIKVLDRTGAGTSASILSGLDFVITRRPEVKLVNLSLGLGNLFAGTCDNAASFTMAFASAIRTLRDRGTTLFASSANNGSPSQMSVPACVGQAMAVGAVYDSDAGMVTLGCTDPTTAADKVACFSNSSTALDLLAPGAPMTSAGIGGGVSTFLGTSQACPAATAVAALLLEARPGLLPDQLEAALKNTGASIPDPRNGATYRRLDAKAAVDSVR